MKRLSILALALAMMFNLMACSSNTSGPESNSGSNGGSSTSEPSSSGNGEEWKPSRTIELVACYAAGGGHDILLRTMQKIIADENLSSANFNVVNKDGGSGAIGMAYVDGHAGDPHYLSLIHI